MQFVLLSLYRCIQFNIKCTKRKRKSYFFHLIVRLNSAPVKLRLLSLKINAALQFIIYFPDCQDGINTILNMQDYFSYDDIVSILFFNHRNEVKVCQRKICICDFFF